MIRIHSLLAVAFVSTAPIEPPSTASIERQSVTRDEGMDELPETRLQAIWTAELLDRDPVAARQRYQQLAQDDGATREIRALATARWIEIDRIRGERTLGAVRTLRSLGVVIRGRNPLRLGADGSSIRKAIRDGDAARLERLRQQVTDDVAPETVQLRSVVATTIQALETSDDQELDSLRAELKAAEARGDEGEAARLRRLIGNPSLRARVRGPEERVRLLRDLLAGKVEDVIGELQRDGLAERSKALPWPRVRRLIERRIDSAMTTAEERALWRALGTRLRGVLRDPKADLYREALSALVGR